MGVGSNANWGGEKERLKELQDAYREAVDAARARLRTNALLGLLPHIERFVDDVRDRAQARRASRLRRSAVLGARPAARQPRRRGDYFRRRFRAVLIDEFQDTDPVQAELALLLTSDEEPGEDWRALRPAPGRLTVVGDPKQSIYRFRRADIAVYDQVKTRPLADGGERISTNFRSNPALLDALNARVRQDPRGRAGRAARERRARSTPRRASPRGAPPIVLAEGTSTATPRASARRRRA